MLRLLWLIPLLPAAGFVANGLLGPRFLPRRAVGVIACAAVLGAFLLSLGAVLELSATGGDGGRYDQSLYTWIPLGPGSAPRIEWAYALDPLSAVMLLVVTGVGFLIHVYATGYMGSEPEGAYARFFSYLNLFMAMMLVLV